MLWLIIILLLLLLAVYPVCLAVDLAYETAGGELRLLWRPLPLLRWQIPLYRQGLGQGSSLSQIDYRRLDQLLSPLKKLGRGLHLQKFACQGTLPVDLAGDAAKTACLSGLLLAGLSWELGYLGDKLAEFPAEPRLELGLADRLSLRLSVEWYLPLWGLLLHIWRLRRAYFSIIYNKG